MNDLMPTTRKSNGFKERRWFGGERELAYLVRRCCTAVSRVPLGLIHGKYGSMLLVMPFLSVVVLTSNLLKRDRR